MANNLDILLQSLLVPQATQQRGTVFLIGLTQEYPDGVLLETVQTVYPALNNWGASAWGTMVWGS